MYIKNTGYFQKLVSSLRAAFFFQYRAGDISVFGYSLSGLPKVKKRSMETFGPRMHVERLQVQDAASACAFLGRSERRGGVIFNSPTERRRPTVHFDYRTDPSSFVSVLSHKHWLQHTTCTLLETGVPAKGTRWPETTRWMQCHQTQTTVSFFLFFFAVRGGFEGPGVFFRWLVLSFSIFSKVLFDDSDCMVHNVASTLLTSTILELDVCEWNVYDRRNARCHLGFKLPYCHAKRQRPSKNYKY